MKILLTGGTGFIGSYVLLELLQAGHEIVATRRTGSTPILHIDRQPTWLEDPLQNLKDKDLEGIDLVIHLASAGVSPQKASLQDFQEVNVAAGLQLIKLAYDAGVRRFIAAGTCHEYGSEAEVWERIPPNAALRPITLYGASKAAGFMLLHAFATTNPIELLYCRIFNVYGEGQFSENLWPSLRQSAIAGDDFAMSTGEEIRDFIPVVDVARYLRIGAERDDLVPGYPLVVNIGSGTGIRVVDFAMQQWRHFGAKGILMPGAIPSRSCSISRLVADTIYLEPIKA